MLISKFLDLLKIMSMSADKIITDKAWKFCITKEKNYPVLMEVAGPNKKRIKQTPAFMMAILLKEHVKAIEKETGIKPTKLGFCILCKYDKVAKKRIEQQLKEACDLLNVQFQHVNFE